MNIRRTLLLTPLFIVILLAVVYFAFIAWLESRGGRQKIEETLSAQTGMTVRLNGDFNIGLLPSIGVSGTQLTVTDPSTGEEIASGKYFETDLAIAPLLRDELEIGLIQVEGLKMKLPDGYGLFIPRITLQSFGFGQLTNYPV